MVCFPSFPTIERTPPVELTSELMALAALAVLGLTAVVVVWPTFGFALVLGISLVKSLLRSQARR